MTEALKVFQRCISRPRPPKHFDKICSAAVYLFPALLTFLFNPQVKLMVKMNTLIAHVVVIWAQPHPAAILLRQPPVCGAVKNVMFMHYGTAAHITSLFIAYQRFHSTNPPSSSVRIPRRLCKAIQVHHQASSAPSYQDFGRTFP